MSAVSASAVYSLRSRTGVSILECKKALEEAGGDEEKAIEILRQRGIAQAAKKAGREQSEGSIFIAESAGKAAMIFLQCETDFVARDENFQSLGKKIAEALAANGADAAKKVADESVPAMVQKLGENISIGESQEVSAPVIGTYVHSNSKIGVIIGLDGGSVDIARDIAMHAAAMNPQYLRPEDVTADAVEKERNIWKEQMATEGKPPAIMEKIMLGKEKKFREENSLLKQAFVKDTSKTIEQVLEGVNVKAFSRLSVNE